VIFTETVPSQSLTSILQENEYGDIGLSGSLPARHVDDSALLMDAHPKASGSMIKSARRRTVDCGALFAPDLTIGK
jgi:hypothetical protein